MWQSIRSLLQRKISATEKGRLVWHLKLTKINRHNNFLVTHIRTRLTCVAMAAGKYDSRSMKHPLFVKITRFFGFDMLTRIKLLRLS